MSVTTKSMVLLAAMGLAACDSSNSNSSNVVEPEAPELVEPAIAGLTRANAVAEFTGGTEVAERAAAATAASKDLEDANDYSAQASTLRRDILAILGTVTSSDELSNTDETKLDTLTEEFNTLLTAAFGNDVSYDPSDDAIVGLNAFFGVGSETQPTFAKLIKDKTTNLDLATKGLDIRFVVPNGAVAALGKDITLVDGTVLQTAGIAAYTRVDADAVAGTKLKPTASVIVAYETNADGDVIDVRFADHDGLKFDRAPTGTAFARGQGVSYAYLEVAGEDKFRILSGTAALELNFNQQTGQLDIIANGDGTAFNSVSTLVFNRNTGEFTSSTGDFEIVSSDLVIAGDNVGIEGALWGAAEAFSGLFTVTDSRVNGQGGFAGVVETREAGESFKVLGTNGAGN